MTLSKTLEQKLDPKSVDNLKAKLGNKFSTPASAHPFAWLSSPRVVKRTSREANNDNDVTSREANNDTNATAPADDFVTAAINKVNLFVIVQGVKWLGL